MIIQYDNNNNLSLSPTGENLTLAFTLTEFSASSRSFTVKAAPTTTSSPSTNATHAATSGGTSPPDSPVPPTEPEPTAPPAPITTTPTTTTTTPDGTTFSFTTESSTEDSTTDDYPSILDTAGTPSSGSLLLVLTLLSSLFLTLMAH